MTSHPTKIEGTIRVGPIMAIVTLLRELDVDPASLLVEFGLTPAFFDDPENILSFATLGQVLGRCVERTGCAHFGLLLGERAGASGLGTVGYLMQSAPDVHSALAAAVKYLHLHDQGASVSLEVAAISATLSYDIFVNEVPNLDQVLDTALMIAHSIVRGLCGPDWMPTAVTFAHTKPIDVKPFRQAFHVAPHFDAERSTLIFPAAWLSRPNPGADPLLHGMMKARVAELQNQTHDDLVGQLRRMLRKLIPGPDCSLAGVAGRMGIHARTLNRRLSAEGVSFAQLREEAQYEAACQLLELTQMSVSQIAEVLNYADASSFTRAFRRWSGLAPARWKSTRRRLLSRHQRT